MSDPAPKPLVLKPARPKVAAVPPIGVTRFKRDPGTTSRWVKLAPVAVVAIVVGYLTWPSGAPDPGDLGDDGGPIARLAAVDLAIAFPDGWHLAPNATPAGASPHSRSAIVVRGPTTDPGQEAFVAELPLAGSLADAATNDERLLAVARDAERGAAAHLGAAKATYYSEGCTKLGAHAVKCRGTSTAGADSRTVVTHVRLGDKRAIVALFVTRAPDDREVDAIAASMKP